MEKTINIFDLTDHIISDLKEDTVSSDIAYIPGGITTTKQALRALASNKPNWKIDILESDKDYSVDFEGQLKIKIPKEHYSHFNDNVLKIIGLTEADLSGVLNEATQEELNTVYDELTKALTVELKDIFIVENSLFLINSWKRIFGGQYISLENKPLITFSNYDGDVSNLVNRIKRDYGDNIGDMEMVIEAIRNKTPLSSLDIFADYDYLVGTRISSIYNGIKMVFDIAVNMSFKPIQAIWIDDVEVIGEMNYYRKYVKPLHRTLLPVSGQFTPSVFEAIQDVIEDLK